MAADEDELKVCYVTSYMEHFVNKSKERSVEMIFKRGSGQRSQQSNRDNIFGKPLESIPYYTETIK